MSPTALTIEDLCRLLSAASPSSSSSAGSPAGITPAMIEADVAVGAPRNPDGTFHLVHYTAWMVQDDSEKRGSHAGATATTP